MNTRVGDPLWPKWVDSYCELCGDFVPAKHIHTCDIPNVEVDWKKLKDVI